MDAVSAGAGPEQASRPRLLLALAKGTLRAYHQVVAVLAALGIAAVATNIWNIDWHGVLEGAVAFWDSTVRPVTAWVLRVFVTTPLGWVGFTIEFPQWIQDYFSVGIILALSFVRTVYQRREGEEGDDFMYLLSDIGIMWPPFLPLTWPVALLAISLMTLMNLASALSRDKKTRREVVRSVFSLLLPVAPIFYFAALLALNSWVMPFV